MHATYKVQGIRFLTDDTFVLRSDKPDSGIRAGQCFSVGTRDLGINREYSMYSSQDDDFVDFLIRRVDGGAVSNALADLRAGDDVQIGGPYGSFCLDEANVLDKSFVFIASGTGIAPFRSFVASFPSLQYTIFHGVRHESEQYDRDLYPAGSYEAAISRPVNGEGSRVTDLLDRSRLDPESLYYLCGNRNMITDAVSLLRDKRVPGGNIFMETFF